MKIYIGSDHAGYKLKEILKKFLIEEGYEIDDKGAFAFNSEDDYPDFIKPVAEAVVANPGTMGIVLGGSGQGEAISANKTRGIRASVYYGHSLDMITATRQHNNANVLSLGARFVSTRKAKKAVKLFLATPFSGDERHIRRINKLES